MRSNAETTGPLPRALEQYARDKRSDRWFIVACVAVGLLGIAGGAFAGFPGMVERVGQKALARLERRFGVRVEAGRVEWSYGGHVLAKDVVVRLPNDDVLATTASLEVDSDVDLFARHVRLRRIALAKPVLKVTRAADGSSNLDPLLAGLAGMEGGAGGLSGSVTIAPELPEIEMEGVTVALDAVLPKLPLGLTLPGRATFEGGHITLKKVGAAAEGPVAATPVKLEVTFASTSLDPGQGLAFSAEGPLRGPPARVELKPTRPIRFFVGRRVVGIGGIALTPGGVELGPLQLSVPLPEAGVSEVAAAASCDKLVLEPSPREVLARVSAALGGMPRQGLQLSLLMTALGALDKVKVERPVVSLAIDEAGHHDFEDLLGGVRVGALTPPVDTGLVSAVTDASLAASERLLAVSPKAPSGTAPLSKRLSRPMEALAAASKKWLPEVVRALGMSPLKELAVSDGEVMLGLGQRHLNVSALQLTSERGKALSIGFELPDGVTMTGFFEAKLDGDRLHLEAAATNVPVELMGPLAAKVHLEPKGLMSQLAFVLDGDAHGEVWEASTRVSFQDAVFMHPAVAHEALKDLDVQLAGTLRWDGPAGRLTLADGIVQSKGVLLHASLDVADALHVPKLHLALDLPETPLQRLVDALPEGFIPLFPGLRIDGTLRWPVVVDLDSADPAAVKIDSQPEARGFQVLTLGEKVDFNELRTSHSYDILLGDGTKGQRVVGPMTGSWIPLANITPYLPLALTTTEDGTFYSNDGISTRAMKESVAVNLERGSFVRGASTMTQQLVKNLYLGPDKTVSRKLQEIFIAWQMAQHLSKDEVMALYLNTIEFGPGIYGIGDAAWHWFGKRPIDLSLTESIFLASIIPGPRRYYSFFLQGELTPRWQSYIEALLKVMVERGKITEEELTAAAPYRPAFRGAGGGYQDEPPPAGFDEIPEDDDVREDQ